MRRGVIMIVIGTLAALSSGCNPRPAEVRYKVTVEVDDKGATRSGASVWSWAISKPMAALASPYDGRFRGEAVAVDLGSGKTLFALLVNANGEYGYASLLPERLFGDLGRGIRGEKKIHADRQADVRDIARRLGASATIDCANQEFECPMLVTFRDIKDPRTVEQVNPANLSASFGDAVKLKRITVQVTDEDVTAGIGRRLAWLGVHPEPRLDPAYRGSTNPNLSQKLAHGSFRWGTML